MFLGATLVMERNCYFYVSSMLSLATQSVGHCMHCSSLWLHIKLHGLYYNILYTLYVCLVDKFHIFYNIHKWLISLFPYIYIVLGGSKIKRARGFSCCFLLEYLKDLEVNTFEIFNTSLHTFTHDK